jgi:hypothetical protein
MSDLIGKSVLIGLTLVDEAGTEVDRFQTYGTIEVSHAQWIGVRREGFSELFGLPPAQDLLEPAPEGIYTLHSSGERVENPDYVIALTVTCSDPESILALRGIGFESPS